jgi:hypothetical protein
MRDDWYANLGPSKQQKDIVLRTSIADTGAQCQTCQSIAFHDNHSVLANSIAFIADLHD